MAKSNQERMAALSAAKCPYCREHEVRILVIKGQGEAQFLEVKAGKLHHSLAVNSSQKVLASCGACDMDFEPERADIISEDWQ